MLFAFGMSVLKIYHITKLPLSFQKFYRLPKETIVLHRRHISSKLYLDKETKYL
jgi:hypothetical protein